MSTTEPGFTAVCTDALRREGVKGKRAAVTLHAGRLVIAGEDGGAIPIDLADVARRASSITRAGIPTTSTPTSCGRAGGTCSSSVRSPRAIRPPAPPCAPWRWRSPCPAAWPGSSAEHHPSWPGWGPCWWGCCFLPVSAPGSSPGSSASPASPIVSGGSASAPRRRSPFCSLACCGTPGAACAAADQGPWRTGPVVAVLRRLETPFVLRSLSLSSPRQTEEVIMGRASEAPIRRTIRRQQLREMVPLADSTIYEMEQRNEFPRRFALSPRCVVWDLAEVEAWLASRHHGRFRALNIRT